MDYIELIELGYGPLFLTATVLLARHMRLLMDARVQDLQDRITDLESAVRECHEERRTLITLLTGAGATQKGGRFAGL